MAVVLVEGENKLPSLVGNSAASIATQTHGTDRWTTLVAIAASFAAAWL